MHWFVSRDSKGKLRVVEMKAEWCDEEHAFGIYRTTYQYGGKHTEQPPIYIRFGKAARTLREQLDLEYKSNMKKYLDKGETATCYLIGKKEDRVLKWFNSPKSLDRVEKYRYL